MKKVKKFIVMTIACVMLMGTVMTVYAWSPGRCTTMGCNAELVKTGSSIGKCVSCPSDVYLYKCPHRAEGSDGIIPQFYHTTVEARCIERGHLQN